LPYSLPSKLGWSFAVGLGASLLIAAHHVAGFDLAWASSHGSQNLTGTAAGIVASLSSLAAVGAILAIWWWHARAAGDREALVQGAAAAVLAFVVLGKVFSTSWLTASWMSSDCCHSAWAAPDAVSMARSACCWCATLAADRAFAAA